MAHYVDLVRQETDIRILHVPDELVVADDAHRWEPPLPLRRHPAHGADELEVAQAPRTRPGALSSARLRHRNRASVMSAF